MPETESTRAADHEGPTGATLVTAERRRQVDVEGWSLDHDREHGGSVLYRASWAYRSGDQSHWPWDREWWKPKDRLSDLIRAGALLLAAEDVDPNGAGGYAVQRRLVEGEIDRLLAAASRILRVTPPTSTTTEAQR